MSKVLVDRELLEQLLDEGPRSVTWAAQEQARAILAKPAEAQGVEVVAYATPNEDGDWQMLFFDKKEAMLYTDDGQPAPLVLRSAHLAALSAVTAERDRLREEMCRLRAEVEALRPIHAMILNALDRDAEEGKTARGEMAAELRAAMAAKEA